MTQTPVSKALVAEAQEQSTWRRRPVVGPYALPLAVIAALALITVIGPWVAPFDPLRPNVGPVLEGPSVDHLFGTDEFGRDVFSRVLAGARVSLGVSIVGTLVALTLGAVLGGIAASTQSIIGETIMRLLDLVWAFPGILLAVVLAASLGKGATTIIIVVAVIYTPPFARVVRAVVLNEINEDYVTAARLLGSSRIRIVGYQIGLNAIVPVLVFATTVVADAIVLEAALSFIGAGISQPTASWGNVIADGRDYISSGKWWISTFGGAAVFVTVLGLNAAAASLSRNLGTSRNLG
jgi:ABC-type dipeptide/oligopeptide/nickel transport system permease subunit